MYKQFLNRAKLLALLMLGFVAACKQQTVDPNGPTPPAAELSSRVVGQYNLTQLTSNGKTASAEDADLKGGVKISRVSATGVSLDLAINALSTGESIMEGTVSGVTVTDAGNNEVNLVKGSDTIGYGSSNKVIINVKSDSGVTFGLIMTK